MPYADSTVLAGGHDHRKLLMESDRRDVGGVAFECADERFCLVVPHVDGGIVCPTKQAAYQPRGSSQRS